MTSGNGWIKIHRKIQDNFIYTDSQALHLWIHILLECNHTDREYLFNGKKVVTERGSFITGRKRLSEKTGISESKVYRLLKLFKSEHLIEHQKTSKYSIISVVNYNTYQSGEHQNEQQVNNKRTASEQQVNTTKNVKNVKNDNKKDIIIEKFNSVLEENRKFYINKYPGRDHELEFALMAEWIKSNPTKANKKKDWNLFIQAWLNRAKVDYLKVKEIESKKPERIMGIDKSFEQYQEEMKK